jgi:5'-deoxynucleotidase YfbR-like HD superfamily hydrolase
MNKQRRNEIGKLVDKAEELIPILDALASEIETIASEEQEYYDNAPENMVDSEKYERACEVADELESCQQEVREMSEGLGDIRARLEGSVD